MCSASVVASGHAAGSLVRQLSELNGMRACSRSRHRTATHVVRTEKAGLEAEKFSPVQASSEPSSAHAYVVSFCPTVCHGAEGKRNTTARSGNKSGGGKGTDRLLLDAGS